MLKFAAFIALVAQAIAVPQGGPASPAPSGKTISVTVGNGGPKFDPANITATNGDTVLFQFVGPFEHSITESSFATPCTASQGGFNSGLLGNTSQFSLTITDASKPIWFYCQQTTPVKHCGMGMVGSINAPATGNTFDLFLSAASSIGTNEGAQSPTAVLSAAVATGSIGSASNTPSGSAGSPSPSSTAPAGNGGGSGGNGAVGMVNLSMTGLTLALTVVFAALAL